VDRFFFHQCNFKQKHRRRRHAEVVHRRSIRQLVLDLVISNKLKEKTEYLADVGVKAFALQLPFSSF
jgi:hypothetical protein